MNKMKTNIKSQKEKSLSPTQYNEIIEGLQLEKMFLKSCKAKCFSSEITDNNIVKVGTNAEFESYENKKFSITSSYTITAKSNKKNLFKIELEYYLLFHSKNPVDERFFDIYSKRNLRLNTFPLVREIVQSFSGRMGFPPLVLPLLK
ncbi:hypothetical protein AMJ80_04985 [bacterium SM23_31]|nr:MAG: hypothetical protein AMJ80_04985 [bacterium SM23_31]